MKKLLACVTALGVTLGGAVFAQTQVIDDGQGNRVVKNADGSQIITDNQGNKVVIGADGSKVITDNQGNKVVTDGGAQTIVTSPAAVTGAGTVVEKTVTSQGGTVVEKTVTTQGGMPPAAPPGSTVIEKTVTTETAPPPTAPEEPVKPAATVTVHKKVHVGSSSGVTVHKKVHTSTATVTEDDSLPAAEPSVHQRVVDVHKRLGINGYTAKKTVSVSPGGGMTVDKEVTLPDGTVVHKNVSVGQ